MGDYPKKITTRKLVLQKVGIINLDGLYQNMQRWFYDNLYYFDEPTSRIRPGTATGIEYEFKWKAWRKVNEYVQYNIKVFFHIFDAQDIEVIKDGKKVKLTKCRLKIEIDGDMEMDYTGMFGKSRFGQMLYNVYSLFILKEERLMSVWWDELYYRIYKLQTIAKEYLDMEAKGNAYYDMY